MDTTTGTLDSFIASISEDADASLDAGEGTGSLPVAAPADGGPSGDGRTRVAPADDRAHAADEDDAEGAAPEGVEADAGPDAAEPVEDAAFVPPTPRAEVDPDELTRLRERDAAWERLQQAARAQAEQLAEQRKLGEWKQAFERLPDLDEAQLPVAAEAVIGDIRRFEAERVAQHVDAARQDIETYQQSLASLAAAIDDVLTPAQQDQLRAAQKAYLAHRTPEGIEAAKSQYRQVRESLKSQTKPLIDKVAALEGELAKYKRIASGADRAEGAAAVGVPGGATHADPLDELISRIT